MLTRDFEYLSSNVFINYPFVDDVTLSPEGFEGLVVDAAIFMSLPDVPRSLILKRLDLVEFKIRIEDTNGDIFIDTWTSGSVLSNSVFGSYRTIEWGHSGGQNRVILVVNEAQLTSFTYPLEPVNAQFLDKTVVIDPPTVKRIAAPIDSSVDPDALVYLTGDINFRGGINVATNLEDVPYNEGPRQASVVTFNAQNGLGESSDSLCDSTIKEVLTINGVGPGTQGDFIVSPEDCIWWDAPIMNSITLHNDCKPCCGCEDYYDVYRVTLRAHNRLKQMSERYLELMARADQRFQEISLRVAQAKKMVLRMQSTDCRGWQVCVSILLINGTSSDITDYLQVTNTVGVLVPITDPPSFRVYDGRGGYHKWQYVPSDLGHSWTVQKGSYVLITGCYRVNPDLSLVGSTGTFTATFGALSATSSYTIHGNVNKSDYVPSSWEYRYASWISKASYMSRSSDIWCHTDPDCRSRSSSASVEE